MSVDRKGFLIAGLIFLVGALALAALAFGATVDARCPAPHGPFGSSAVAGSSVVCLVDHDVAGKYELWSVPLVGGAAVRLSPALAEDRDVILFRVSLDGSRVAFTCDAVQWTRYELWLVDVDTGGPVRISGAVLFDYDVDTFEFGSQRVAYRQGRNATGNWALYSAPFRANGSVRISAPGSVQQRFSVAGDIVRYSVDSEYASWLYVPISGGASLAGIFADGFESGGVGGWR